ncbi:MAG: phosphoribosylglycinamide formyltransferase [Bacillota bacterium]
MPQKVIGVLVSGSGSNLQAIIDAIESGTIDARIAVVIADRPGVFALERAKNHGIRGICISRKGKSRAALNEAILKELDEAGVDLVVLAGFLSILDARVVARYKNAIMNIHPALIPSFCGPGYHGMHVHEAAVRYGVKVSGATVHFVDEGTDTGPIILQECVKVYPQDDAHALAERVLKVEHRLLPEAVRLFVNGCIRVEGRQVIISEKGNGQ